MIKARPVAGDIAFGENLLAELRPWVYPAQSSWESCRRHAPDAVTY